MQLHVLGPAFGLPSIDAHCNAAVAFLRSDALNAWSIVPTHDQARQLPYLLDGDDCIEGFKNIARHLREHEDNGDTSTGLDGRQLADSIAISSFIESNAQTLLDISLYVSFENYSRTRTAFTKILPWHVNYTIPPKRRTAARARTDHLGISSIDVDDVHEDLSDRPSGFDVGKEKTFEAKTQQRASLILPRKDTVRSLLQRPEHSAVFTMHALAENFFGPLQDMLGDKEYFLGTSKPQTVDCLAYGYLSLMLYPELTQKWLASTMRKSYPRLARYTERMYERLGLKTDVEAVMTLAECNSISSGENSRSAHSMSLPWHPSVESSFVDVATTIIRDVLSRIPLLGSRVELVADGQPKMRLWQRYFPAILAAAATSVGLLTYSAFATGLLVWPQGEAVHIFGRKRFADYGHLGAALAGVSLLSRQATQNTTLHPQDLKDQPVRVEVEVEMDKHDAT